MASPRSLPSSRMQLKFNVPVLVNNHQLSLSPILPFWLLNDVLMPDNFRSVVVSSSSWMYFVIMHVT
ncbi:hypothetical protein Dimus_036613 [Dionaea muscipula]